MRLPNLPNWGLAVLTVLLLATTIEMMTLDHTQLHHDSAPYGIVSFELAGDAHTASDILQGWGPSGQKTALYMQGLDNLYLLLYPTWFAVLLGRCAAALGPAGCAKEKAKRRSLRAAVGRACGLAAWVVLYACPLFDYLENSQLDAMLFEGRPSIAHASRARVFAIVKFAALAVGVCTLVVGTAARLLLRA